MRFVRSEAYVVLVGAENGTAGRESREAEKAEKAGKAKKTNAEKSKAEQGEKLQAEKPKWRLEQMELRESGWPGMTVVKGVSSAASGEAEVDLL